MAVEEYFICTVNRTIHTVVDIDLFFYSVNLLRLQNAEVSVIEFNIRYLGGLLSAYSLTGDVVCLLCSIHYINSVYAARSIMYSEPPSISPNSHV